MSGEVSIMILKSSIDIKAEHLVLKFFLIFGLHLPKYPSIHGIPKELPHPSIVNLVFIVKK